MGEQFLAQWRRAEAVLPRLIDVWTKLVVLVERHEKRQQQVLADNSKFVEMLNRFTAVDNALYPHKDTDKPMAGLNREDTLALNDSLANVSAFFDKTTTLLVDESYDINTTVLERFKNYLDYLYSLQELFERSKRLLINLIPQLQQKIQDSEARYEKLSKDGADVKGSEVFKLKQAIVNDKQEMFQQLNKDWLIKSCCFEELVGFQETQFLVLEAWADWCKGRYKFQEKYVLLFQELNEQVVPYMPLG